MKVTIKKAQNTDKSLRVELPKGTVEFGSPSHKVKPGTSDGDAYCARSEGMGNTRNPYSANYWSRRNWHCEGAKSRNGRPLKPGDVVYVPDSLL